MKYSLRLRSLKAPNRIRCPSATELQIQPLKFIFATLVQY